MSLRQAQRAMWRAVRFEPTPEDALAVFAGDARLDAAGRAAVYRNMYWYRQVEALGTCFPMVRDRLGLEAFTKLACKHIRKHPSQHVALEYLGREMPAFLAEHAPEVAGLSRLEWARNLALLAPDPARVCTPADIDPRAFGEARFGFVPSLQLVRVGVEALGLFDADAATELDAEAGEGGRVTVALFRPRFTVRHRVVWRAEADALHLARAGARVQDVLASFEGRPDGVQRAFDMLRAWLTRQWIGEINP